MGGCKEKVGEEEDEDVKMRVKKMYLQKASKTFYVVGPSAVSFLMERL